MSLVIELLLIDAAGVGDPSHRLSDHAHRDLTTGRGVYSDLGRQLQDANSHLRRKSAFGALIAHGASIRFLQQERATVAEAASLAAAATAGPDAAAGSTPVSADGICRAIQTPGLVSTGASTPHSGGGVARGSDHVARAVPPISYFPKPSNSYAQVVGGRLFESLLGWWPSCTPEPCKISATSAVACKIPVWEQDDACMEMGAAACPDGDSDSLGSGAGCGGGVGGQLEAGLGGWPLSLPRASVLFLRPLFLRTLGASNGGGAGSTSAVAGGNDCGLASASFRRAAVEVDDEELTVIIAPQRGGVGGGQKMLESAPTPSTASTAASVEEEASLPSWVTYSRLVFPRAEVSSARLWSASEVCGTWPEARRGAAGNEVGPPWIHVVEVAGRPRGAPEAVAVLLALPTAAVAKRLHGAAAGRPPRTASAAAGAATAAAASVSGPPTWGAPPAPPAEGSGRGHGAPAVDARDAVRCEMHVAAKMDLGPGGVAGTSFAAVNFAAVVRRGICEACHVGVDRVRVCSVWDGGVQLPLPDLHPSRAASPRPDAASPLPPPEAVGSVFSAAAAVGPAPSLEGGAEEEPEVASATAASAPDFIDASELVQPPLLAEVEVSDESRQEERTAKSGGRPCSAVQ